MLIKEICITNKMGIKLLKEDDLYLVKLYETNLTGYKENTVYKCNASDSSMEEMIEHINNTSKIIMAQQ
ncbi:MAG: hypothetical protein ACRDD7_10125 [Peptostreptococcaceae bacterium]